MYVGPIKYDGSRTKTSSYEEYNDENDSICDIFSNFNKKTCITRVYKLS